MDKNKNALRVRQEKRPRIKEKKERTEEALIRMKNVKFTSVSTILIFISSFLLCIGSTLTLQKGYTKEAFIRGGLVSILVFFFMEMLFVYMLLYFPSKHRKRDTLMTFLLAYSTILIILIMQHTVHPFAMPIAIVALGVGITINRNTGLVASVFVTMATTSLSFAFSLAPEVLIETVAGNILSLLSAFGMIFLINKNETRGMLLWGTLLVSAVSTPVAFLTAIMLNVKPTLMLIAGLSHFVGNLVAIATFTAGLPIIESIFNIWTNLKMAEYSSFDQPILRKLATVAPGTFQHSLAVGNLAESCAIAIRENPYMARLAGYYHDVGKMKNPEFFTENQVDGYNPHDDIIPELSVKVITKHTTNGYEMLRKARLPEEIAVIALEHHGTTQAMYFYKKAKSITEGDLDTAEYSYDGPLPSSKISAIVMLCDIVEATTRSRMMNKSQLASFLDDTIKEKIISGQFNNCEITLKDLAIIKDTLVNSIPAIHHSRIDYNKPLKKGL